MNEKKKGIILLIIAIALVIFVVSCVVINYISSKKLLEKFNTYYNSSEAKIVVLGKEGCSYCEAFLPELDFMTEEYGFSYEYIGVDKLTSSHYKELLKKLEINESDFGTPYTVVVQNGKKVDELSGAVEENELLTFLKDNKFISDDSKLLINYIDYSQYEKLINSSDTQIIAIGRTSCIYCKMTKPVLNRVIKKYNVNINYVNYDLLSEEEFESLTKSFDFLSSEEWGTPTFLIVQNGELLDTIQGYQSEDTFVEVFKSYGLIGD